MQNTIQEKVPEAMFTHYYAHKLNLVLLHSAKYIPEDEAFFLKTGGLEHIF